MFAMPGLRALSPAAASVSEGVSCHPDGVFVGGVSLMARNKAGARVVWSVRPLTELNKQLSERYRLEVDVIAKAGALALVAKAFNHGDLTLAAVATAQMRFPDPPPLVKDGESHEEIERRADELRRSGLLKFWDPAKHPRTGTPPNPGWFAPTAGEADAPSVVPVAMSGNPWDKPVILEGGGGGGVPRGQLELPFPKLPMLRWSWRSPPEPPPPPPQPPAPEPQTPAEKPPAFPFMEEQPPQPAPYGPGQPTSAIFRAGDLTVELQSGYDGPAVAMQGNPGFDRLTLSHVEGHAAALMRQLGLTEGTLEINNPIICGNCTDLLPTMLPPGAVLRVILPDDSVRIFKGRFP